ncbi:TetR/AcrR family transcriptional regulator [Sphingobium sp. C100]|uniref:TetR/AcrR family transcriptional regulator n=1 Tax=Sphingobium sp. C100 TaxID=1207055 RepID=UPI0012685FF6|nr:TetR/AcrR family transcriptional regulator [Sphingobium sp. C100]
MRDRQTGRMSKGKTQPKDVSPARYDGRENRRLLLDAALRVFSDQGFEGASTRAIAAAAGIEQGHLAYYFPSKMALWQQVIETFARQGETYLMAHLTPDALADPVATAHGVLPGFLRTFASNPRLTRLMLQEFSVLSARHEWVVANFGQPVWRLLEPLFNGLQAQRRLAGAPPVMAYFTLIGAALITFGNPELIARLSGVEVNETEWADKAIEHMLVPIFAPA